MRRVSTSQAKRACAACYAPQLMGAVGIHRVGSEDGHTDQAEDGCGDLDHGSISCFPIATRKRPRDRLQMNSKMACMVASLFG